MERRKYQWIRELEEAKIHRITTNTDNSYKKLAKKIAKNFARKYEKYNTKELGFYNLSLSHNRNKGNYTVFQRSKIGLFYFHFKFVEFNNAKLADAVGKTLRLWNYPVQKVICESTDFGELYLLLVLK